MKKKLKYSILLLFVSVSYNLSAQVPILNSYSAAQATVYLDFDGAEVEGTLWNESGKITAAASGLTPASITWIHKIVSEYFVLFNLNITTDPEVYERAPVHQRVRIIITPDGNWYGPATGVSAIGSFVWGDDTPGFVFMNPLSNNPNFIAAATTHEIGHTLGLQHQSVYDSYGSMITELSGGESNAFSSQAPLMGIPFYKKAGWENGHPSTGADRIQSDTADIAGAPNNIGYRKTVTQETARETAFHIERTTLGSIDLISFGNYSYRIFDIGGRLLTQGQMIPGFNAIRTNTASSGVFLLQWSGESNAGSEKIIL